MAETAKFMEETARSFAPLLLAIFLAFIVPLVLTRLNRQNLPIVIGEIIAGTLVGRISLKWVHGDDPVFR